MFIDFHELRRFDGIYQPGQLTPLCELRENSGPRSSLQRTGALLSFLPAPDWAQSSWKGTCISGENPLHWMQQNLSEPIILNQDQGGRRHDTGHLTGSAPADRALERGPPDEPPR